MWRLGRKAVPTKDRLLTKGLIIEGGCYLFGRQSEAIEHLFLECPVTKNALQAAGIESVNLDNLER